MALYKKQSLRVSDLSFLSDRRLLSIKGPPFHKSISHSAYTVRGCRRGGHRLENALYYIRVMPGLRNILNWAADSSILQFHALSWCIRMPWPFIRRDSGGRGRPSVCLQQLCAPSVKRMYFMARAVSCTYTELQDGMHAAHGTI